MLNISLKIVTHTTNSTYLHTAALPGGAARAGTGPAAAAAASTRPAAASLQQLATSAFKLTGNATDYH